MIAPFSPTYPANKAQAHDILNAIRAGLGQNCGEHLINYCLLLTGDL